MRYVRTILMAGTLGATILFPFESLMFDAAVPTGSLIRAAAAGGRGSMSDLGPGSASGRDAVAASARQREHWRMRPGATVPPVVKPPHRAGSGRSSPAAPADMPTATAKPMISAQALRRPTLFEYLRGIARD